MGNGLYQGQGDKGVAGGTGFLHYSADGKLVTGHIEEPEILRRSWGDFEP